MGELLLTAGAACSYFVVGSGVAVKRRRAVRSISAGRGSVWRAGRLNRPSLSDITSEEAGSRSDALGKNSSSLCARSSKQKSNSWKIHLELDYRTEKIVGVLSERLYE